MDIKACFWTPRAVLAPDKSASLSSHRDKPWSLRAALLALITLSAAFTGCSKGQDEKNAADAKAPDPLTTGRLVVKSNIPGTTIDVMRPASSEAKTPARLTGSTVEAAEHVLTGVPAGQHTLAARARGWPEIHQDVTVTAGSTTEVTVHFKSGSLRLDSDPTGAKVRRGENVLGQTPLVLSPLPVGECQLILDHPALSPLTFNTVISENQESVATAHLPHGKLTVETTPSGATVLQGKTVLGQTPLVLEKIQPGPKKLTLQAKDFPTLEVTTSVEDRGHTRINQPMGIGFPELDPAELLRTVWVPDNADKIAPSFDSVTGPNQPRNGIVKNLHRKTLYENWLRRNFRLTSTIKSYDQQDGEIEFAEQKTDLCRYRIVAKLSLNSIKPELTAQLSKGASVSFYGRLTAVEEPRWPLKVITLEFSEAALLP